MPIPTIHYELLTQAELSIVEEAVNTRQWDEVSVRRFERFGHSGAKILVLRNYAVPGVPLILKIAESRKISAEFRGASDAKNFISHFPSIELICDGEPHQGVLYELFESESSHGGVTDLNDLYRTSLISDAPDASNTVSSHIKDALSLFVRYAHVSAGTKLTSTTYGELFKDYLRKNHETHVNRIGNLFDNNPTGLKLYGRTIRDNPLGEFQDQLESLHVNNFIVGFVHGDLHPSNIVLSNSTTNLIDFAWAHKQGHLFVDYVMFESSMRFKEFPRDVNPGRLLQIDAILNEGIYNSDEAIKCAQDEPSELARRKLTAMTKAVIVVREMLKSVLSIQFPNATKQEINTEYNRVMYLVLAGQQRFDTFPVMRTTLNLHMLRRGLGI